MSAAIPKKVGAGGLSKAHAQRKKVWKMLSDQEKQKCEELLSKLETQDLTTLTDTVTNRMVSAQNRTEAIKAVLLFSQGVEELLRRKKLKRDVLYLFLVEKGVVAPPTADKPFLIQKLLELWDCRSKQEINSVNDEQEDVEKVDGAHRVTVHSTNSSAVDGQKLAEHFVPWFFGILNSVSQGSVAIDWGPQHFWNDSKCKVFMASGDTVMDECRGSSAVSDKLFSLASTEKLVFNVNENGIKGQLDVYGLARITAGGTVHRFSQCIGIFEQAFGLIRDPEMQNNWKIKFTELNLRAHQAIQGSDVPAVSSGRSALALHGESNS